MHTTKTNNVSFFHDGDYSGAIYIVGKDRNGNDNEVLVKMDDFRDFLMQVLKGELVKKFENSDLGEMLKITESLGVKFPGTADKDDKKEKKEK